MMMILNVDDMKVEDFNDLDLKTLNEDIKELEELVLLDKEIFIDMLNNYREYKKLFNGNGEILSSFTTNNKYNINGVIFVKNNKIIDLIRF